MKKLLTIILSISMIFLVACSNEKPLVVADSPTTGDKVHVEFYGQKDDVKKMYQTVTYNLSENDDETIEKYVEDAKTKAKDYENLPIEYNVKKEGKNAVEELTLNFENIEDNKTLQQVGLLNYPGNLDEKIKIEPFIEALEQAGYTIEKNFK